MSKKLKENFLIGLSLFICFVTPSYAADSLCARVKIEIKQELTLERQAFDAHMKINNGMTHIPLENVKIVVNFANEAGQSVTATSDSNITSALFFIRVNSMENINAVDGSGAVAPSTSADIHWLIIPAPGAAKGAPQGTLYYVGATLTYTMGGEEQVTEVNPDYIFVKPMPELTLDYFLPVDVYGDDAFTSAIEPPIPFSLGVRVLNSGAGAARKLKIESAQPKIVENKLGLLIGFIVEGSEVNGNPATKSLLADFGDIAPNTSGVGRWIMTCSLSGKFIEFTADYTHSDELGGELTSLLEAVNTHFLVRDVLVDLPGRDNIRDFLAKEGEGYKVYESESVDTVVSDQSASSTLQLVGQSGTKVTYNLTTPVTAGFMFVKLSDPHMGTKTIKEVVRSDNKNIRLDNAWLSKTRYKDNPWEYFVNLFDANSTGSYTIKFDAIEFGAQPPVLHFISDKTRAEGQQLAFLVESSDPNGTIPILSASPLPPLAKFTDQGNGTGIFDWTPAAGQSGRYQVTFTVSDGVLTDSQLVVFTICSAADTDCDGMPDDCELTYFGNLNRDGNGDFNGNGISDRDECLNGTDPTYKSGNIKLMTGLNIFGYPVQVPMGYTSYKLLMDLGNENEVNQVLRYNKTAGTFDTTEYLNSLPIGQEFPIVSGEGYYIYMKADKTVSFAGNVVCPNINLMPGLNIVSFLCVVPGFTSADLLLYLGTSEDVASIQRLNIKTGAFETTTYYNDKVSGKIFAITGGEAYLIYMKKNVTVITPIQ